MADESRVDAIIDEDGRLFGLVNIIDALVVLLVVAILVAGFALVGGVSGGQSTETRYATIDVGTQPSHIAGQITAGDTWDAGGGDALTITDVYKYPQGGDDGGGVSVLVRARVNGSAIGGDTTEAQSISFAGEPLRFGRTLQIATAEYLVEGQVTDITEDGSSLETTSRQLVVQTEVERDTAVTIQPGDAYQVGGEPLVTVESVTIYPTGNPETRRAMLGVTAQTRTEQGTTYIGDVPLRTGISLPIQTNAYSLSGSVTRIGSLDEPGVPATRTITLQMENVPSYKANAITAGMTESAGDVETAEIISKEATSGGGLQLTVEVSVRERDDGTIRFRGQPLRIGQELTLELESVTATGEVTDISV